MNTTTTTTEEFATFDELTIADKMELMQDELGHCFGMAADFDVTEMIRDLKLATDEGEKYYVAERCRESYPGTFDKYDTIECMISTLEHHMAMAKESLYGSAIDEYKLPIFFASDDELVSYFEDELRASYDSL